MDTTIFTADDARRMRDLSMDLVEWYHRSARALPWRQDPTPYRVWISEIMLQQTRVEAVRPYFARFMEALPGIGDLAAVEETALFKLWEGLGYYSRARNLKKAAQVILADYDGCMPADYEALLGLPGIGPYTAGAIASIAFGIPAAAVDGNVLRVLARLLCKRENMQTAAVKKAAHRMLTDILPPGFPGDFNQAMMELGATVCVPGVPRCTGCPAAGHCLGLQRGCAGELPLRPAKRQRKILRRTVPVILAPAGVLLRRRPDTGLLAGLWEFPAADGWLDPEAAAGLAEALGGRVARCQPLEDSRHIFTHLEWHMRGYAVYTDDFPPPDGYVWAAAGQLQQDYALPSAYKAYLKDALRLLRQQAAGLGGA